MREDYGLLAKQQTNGHAVHVGLSRKPGLCAVADGDESDGCLAKPSQRPDFRLTDCGSLDGEFRDHSFARARAREQPLNIAKGGRR
ncbi:hypothetical protein ACLB9X_34230 [Streptomyces sp. 5K101]|uniref:hypothetical protein n=1 Tax=Streptomyces sp. 5K101 TaxID=3390037 RepID=UPI003975AAC3